MRSMFFFLRQISRNSKKVDFLQNFEILFPGSGPSIVTKIFFPDALWASPYNESRNLTPTPENLAKVGCKVFGRWSPSGGLGQYCRGRFKTGKGVP